MVFQRKGESNECIRMSVCVCVCVCGGGEDGGRGEGEREVRVRAAETTVHTRNSYIHVNVDTADEG